MKKKILFIHHSSSWGGSINSLIQLITSLDQDKFAPKVLLLKDSSLKDVLKEKSISFVLAKSLFYRCFYKYFVHSEADYLRWYQVVKFGYLSILWLLSRFVFAPQELKRIDFDIAHLNSSVLTDWLAPCKRKGKTILHIREPFRKGKFDILYPFFRNQMKHSADRIIAISKDNANRVKLPDKTTVVYNYMSNFSRKINMASYASKKFLYLGGSAKIKGFFTMVDALKYLDKEIKVLFAGNYSSFSKSNLLKRIIKWITFYDKKQKKAIKKIERCKNAHIIGLCKNISTVLENVCCVVSPFSKPHFARPVIEAYLHKKPAIGSDVEGMEEIIEHRNTGLLVSKNNGVELASAMNLLAKQPQKVKRMGETGFRVASERFSSSNIKQIENIYFHLTKQN